MITLVILLSITAAAIPIARLLDRNARGTRILALSFLVGSGIVSFTLYVAALIGLRWSALVAYGPLLVASVVCFLRNRDAVLTVPRIAQRRSLAATLIDIVVMASFAGYVVYATIAAPWEWDYWAIWGLKAKRFLTGMTIDWAWLASPLNSFMHPDYPLHLPLLFDALAIPHGGWHDRWFGLVNVFYALSAFAVGRSFLAEEERSHVVVALASAAFASAAMTVWFGMGEGPLIAYCGAGALYIRRALKGDPRAWICGSLLLGLGAWTKNEGLTFVIAATVGVLLAASTARVRNAFRLWPAYLIAASWQMVRLVRHLQTDLFEGEASQRLIDKLGNVKELALALVENVPDRPLFWLAIALTVAFFARVIWQREPFLLVAAVAQSGFYLGAYLFTPHEVGWHVASSWVRLLDQIALPLVALTVFTLAHQLRGAQAADETEDAHDTAKA